MMKHRVERKVAVEVRSDPTDSGPWNADEYSCRLGLSGRSGSVIPRKAVRLIDGCYMQKLNRGCVYNARRTTGKTINIGNPAHRKYGLPHGKAGS
jgi:hypothetical protein